MSAQLMNLAASISSAKYRASAGRPRPIGSAEANSELLIRFSPLIAKESFIAEVLPTTYNAQTKPAQTIQYHAVSAPCLWFC